MRVVLFRFYSALGAQSYNVTEDSVITQLWTDGTAVVSTDPTLQLTDVTVPAVNDILPDNIISYLNNQVVGGFAFPISAGNQIYVAADVGSLVQVWLESAAQLS